VRPARRRAAGSSPPLRRFAGMNAPAPAPPPRPRPRRPTAGLSHGTLRRGRTMSRHDATCRATRRSMLQRATMLQRRAVPPPAGAVQALRAGARAVGSSGALWLALIRTTVASSDAQLPPSRVERVMPSPSPRLPLRRTARSSSQPMRSLQCAGGAGRHAVSKHFTIISTLNVIISTLNVIISTLNVIISSLNVIIGSPSCRLQTRHLGKRSDPSGCRRQRPRRRRGQLAPLHRTTRTLKAQCSRLT
jgi:hypothetical protein